MLNKSYLTFGGLLAMSMTYALAAESAPMPHGNPQPVSNQPTSMAQPSTNASLSAHMISQATIGEPVADTSVPPVPQPLLGARLEPVSPLLAYHLPIAAHGALVAQVDPQSPAAAFGLRNGDIVIAINHQLLSKGTAQCLELLMTPTPQPPLLLVLQAGQPKIVVWGSAPVAAVDHAPFNRAVAVNLTLPDGTVSVTGVNGQYQLDAQFRNAQNQLQRLRHSGSLEDIDQKLEQLPARLKDLTRQRLK